MVSRGLGHMLFIIRGQGTGLYLECAHRPVAIHARNVLWVQRGPYYWAIYLQGVLWSAQCGSLRLLQSAMVWYHTEGLCRDIMSFAPMVIGMLEAAIAVGGMMESRSC